MKKERKSYSTSFKENTVKLSYERKSVSELSKELGVPANFIYRWRKEMSTYEEGSFPGNGRKKITTGEKELQALEAENKRLSQELAILKKALGIISRSEN